jgi:hypothetical protein
MSHAVVNQATAKVRQLDATRGSPTPVTEQTVKDAPTVVRLVTGLLRDVSRLLGAWSPRTLDFENIVSTGSSGSPQTFQLIHGFDSNVRWWVIDITNRGTTSITLIDRTLPDDSNILTLRFYWPATFCIRVEAAG